jgi:hypothetical protein
MKGASMDKKSSKVITLVETGRKGHGTVPELVKKLVYGKSEVMDSEGKYPAMRDGAKRSGYKPSNFSSAV